PYHRCGRGAGSTGAAEVDDAAPEVEDPGSVEVLVPGSAVVVEPGSEPVLVDVLGVIEVGGGSAAPLHAAAKSTSAAHTAAARSRR
ncbi:MAG: hypothetical protein M3349_03410, partial [Actinomycetota bacterium]|nr:hypothetical protein [Actinomycetota bacterium]